MRSKTESERAPDGAAGWDEYAPFYDWENAQTVGRRDVAFWRDFARSVDGRVLELGCGTGRITIPLARVGIRIAGVDRSAPMLARAQAKGLSPSLVQADIRALPFRKGTFSGVLAPYGILQSLTREADLRATLASAASVLRRGGVLGIDLVPDVPNWREYSDRVQLRGRAAAGAHFTLVESVRQDRRRRLTTFDQRYIVRRGRRVSEHRFVLTFRTLSVRQMTRRLEQAGFAVDSVLGDYRGRPWAPSADVWIIVAKKM